MKILHTADLHLRENAPERWEALEELINLACLEEVQVMTISGDLFDDESSADNLRPGLRSLFAGKPLDIIILPGNHDAGAYREGLYFGGRVKVLSSWTRPIKVGNIAFWGPPFDKISGEQLLARLMEMGRLMNKETENILLMHGELLDAFFSRQDMGDEGEQRYMPVKLRYFEHLPVSYVLSGHFHSRFNSWLLPGGGLFIYPGSPVAITRRETGRRSAVLLSPGHEPAEIPLDTFHYEHIEINLDPFDKPDPRPELQAGIEKLHPRAALLLTVSGYFDGAGLKMTETELEAALVNIAEPFLDGEPVFSCLDVSRIVEDELFKRFREALTSSDAGVEMQNTATEMAIKALGKVNKCF